VGSVVGAYLDSNNLFHACLRDTDGNFTTFDGAPGGHELWQLHYCLEHQPRRRNLWGYADSNFEEHGCARDPDGNITSFEVAGAGTLQYYGTYTFNINPAGMISSDYIDANFAAHGFLIGRGAAISVDVPGATMTIPANNDGSLNPKAAIAGYYVSMTSPA
jgi:hypothetical protein